MNKICTNLEQSKRLIKLGIDIDTADMHYEDCEDGFKIHCEPSPFGYEYNIPAWSLTALLSVLPFHLIVDNQRYAFSMIKGSDKNGETYAIKYAIYNTTFYFHLTDFYNNPVDACVEMITKLHELKLL